MVVPPPLITYRCEPLSQWCFFLQLPLHPIKQTHTLKEFNTPLPDSESFISASLQTPSSEKKNNKQVRMHRLSLQKNKEIRLQWGPGLFFPHGMENSKQERAQGEMGTHVCTRAFAFPCWTAAVTPGTNQPSPTQITWSFRPKMA